MEFHGTAINSYKTKTVFLKELLKNRDIPALAKGRPLKRDRTLSLENNLSDLNKTLNKKKRLKTLKGEEATISRTKPGEIHMRPNGPRAAWERGPQFDMSSFRDEGSNIFEGALEAVC
jgi:hypothetical protein